MKYIFFVCHPTYDSENRNLFPAGVIRMHRIAKIIASYSFEKIILFAYPKPPVISECAGILSEKLHCTIEYTVAASWEHVKDGNFEKEAERTLSSLIQRQKEHQADAIAYIGEGTALYHTAQKTMQKFLSAVSFSKKHLYFKQGDLSVIDLEKGKIKFFKSP